MESKSLFDAVKRIKQCSAIHFQNNTMVFVGKKYLTFHLGNKILSLYPEIHPTAWKSEFLPDNRLLVDGGADGKYHLLSVKDGQCITSWKAPGNRIMRSNRFALSPSGNVVFDFWQVKNQYYIVKIDVTSCRYMAIPIQTELRVIRDIVCVSENEVYLLQMQTDDENGNSYTSSRITAIKFTDSGYFPVRLYAWKSPGSIQPYSTDGHYVLYNNLLIYDLLKKESYSLLENTDIPSMLKGKFTSIYYDQNRGLLQLCNGKYNEYIDCKNRKLVARYLTPGCSFAGCIVNDEFWIPSESGIQRKHFPMIDIC